jgi:hypothetical protein
VDCGPNTQDDEVEPQEDVDLLIDDIQSEHAQPVLVLDRAGGTILVKGALGNLIHEEND